MKPPKLLMVPYREVRHDRPDDCLHYEPVAVRGEEMDWTIPAHRHEGLHQFQLLERGAITGTIDGRPFEAAAPALLMLAPGSVHGFTYTKDAIGHQVTVPSATLGPLLGDTQLARAGLGASFVESGDAVADAARECAIIFAALAQEFQSYDAGRVQMLLANTTLLAVRFLRSRGEADGPDRRKALPDTLVQRYRTLVEVNYRSHEPLAFYAGLLGVTPDHLARICKKVTGQSAVELLHERVMLEARRLLAYTPMAITDVAQQLGYHDPAYFTKFFTRQVGQTPTAYRTAVAAGVSR